MPVQETLDAAAEPERLGAAAGRGGGERRPRAGAHRAPAGRRREGPARPRGGLGRVDRRRHPRERAAGAGAARRGRRARRPARARGERASPRRRARPTRLRGAGAARRRRPRRAVRPGRDAAHPGDGVTPPARRGRKRVAAGGLDVDALLDDPATRIVVCCGSGGVGKTTTAAALGVRAAERGRRVVVLTIDPARRLAQALGIEQARQHPARGHRALGRRPARRDDARHEAHLRRDRRRALHARQGRADPGEPLLPGALQARSRARRSTWRWRSLGLRSQADRDGTWDLVVVDTPPSRSALDFLDAPQRLGSFLDGRFIRLLTAPAKAGGRAYLKVFAGGVNLVTSTLTKVLGASMLTDVQTFVAALDTMFGGFRERADRTYEPAEGARHRVPRRRRPRARRPARGRVLRRPAGQRGHAARRAGAQPGARVGREPVVGAGAQRGRDPRRAEGPRAHRAGCCGCTPTACGWPSGRPRWPSASPAPTPTCRWCASPPAPPTSTTSTGCGRSAPTSPVADRAPGCDVRPSTGDLSP
nr:ArsA-related P-loop ATPase [Angustibacter aerolatus]